MIRPPLLLRLALALLAAAAVPLAGCASSSGGLSGEPSEYGSPTGEVAATRFLEAANRQDYQGMSQQFGTRSGPAETTMGVTEVEQRMMVLAGLLGHDSFELQRRDLARIGPNRARYVATMQGTRRGTVQLPVITVESEEGRWFVERLVMDQLTRQQ